MSNTATQLAPGLPPLVHAGTFPLTNPSDASDKSDAVLARFQSSRAGPALANGPTAGDRALLERLCREAKAKLVPELTAPGDNYELIVELVDGNHWTTQQRFARAWSKSMQCVYGVSFEVFTF
ncbi:MAG: hypothetical protein AAFQ66_05915 [Pseudomonadota bacterium]